MVLPPADMISLVRILEILELAVNGKTMMMMLRGLHNALSNNGLKTAIWLVQCLIMKLGVF